jgi:hypothetical protein
VPSNARTDCARKLHILFPQLCNKFQVRIGCYKNSILNTRWRMSVSCEWWEEKGGEFRNAMVANNSEWRESLVVRHTCTVSPSELLILRIPSVSQTQIYFNLIHTWRHFVWNLFKLIFLAKHSVFVFENLFGVSNEARLPSPLCFVLF